MPQNTILLVAAAAALSVLSFIVCLTMLATRVREMRKAPRRSRRDASA